MLKNNILHSKIIGEGRPFVILHGFLGMGDNWKTHGKNLSEEGFQVHLVDQRNHGRSFWSDVFNYDILVQDLKNYCDKHRLQNIILFGHSMGGKTAMLFASKYPELVSKLLVADISPRFYPVHHDRILEGLSTLNFDVLKSRGEADTVLSGYISHLGIRQFLLKNLYWIEKGKLALRINLKVLKEEITQVGEPLPSSARFEKEALFIRGDQSDYIRAGDESLINNHFPKAKIVTISNSGHWLHAENPEDFFEAIMQFVH